MAENGWSLPFALDPLIAEAKRRARRRWALLAAAGVLVLAGGGTTAAGFFAYHHYHRTKAIPIGLVRVLVATKLIQKGTPGDLIRTTNGRYKITTLPKKFVQAGAILSPATLAGRVALTDINPGQQLTTAELGPCGCILTPGPGLQTDVTIPLSSSDTVGRQVSAGSHVDIWVATSTTTGSRGELRELYGNMYVVAVNDVTVTLRATPPHSGKLIYLTGHRNYRLVLRLHK